MPGSSFEATDDWAKYLSIEGINKSEKTISYVTYAIDFTIAGENSLYRLRLQDGTFYAFPDALKAPGGLRILKGQTHNMRFTDDAWRCHSNVVGKINERKARIVKCFSFVQTFDEKPRRRLWELLRSQGMAENQQVDFLSDGGDTVRSLQEYIPNSEHWIDWFHITMRITVLLQQVKGLEAEPPELGKEVTKEITSGYKQSIWHKELILSHIRMTNDDFLKHKQIRLVCIYLLVQTSAWAM